MKPINLLFLQWLDSRDNREKMLFFFTTLILIYIVWNSLVLLPLKHHQQAMREQIQELNTKTLTLSHQFDEIIHILHNPLFTQSLKTAQLNSLSNEEADQAIQAILDQQQSYITFVSLKNDSVQALALPGLETSLEGSALFQHPLQLQFKGDYFNTLAYLDRLEKLPWELYWDSLEYRVDAYPEATITVKFYLLTNAMS